MIVSPNRTIGRKGTTLDGELTIAAAPEIIVLHRTAGTFRSAIGWLRNPDSQASASVVLSKTGQAEWLVPDEDSPWTNGFAKDQTVPPTSAFVRRRYWDGEAANGHRVSPSRFTLSVECEWLNDDGVIPVGSAQYRALVKIIADWCKCWGIPPTRERIIGHNEICPREKPACGQHIPWDSLIADVQKAVGIDAPSMLVTYAAAVEAPAPDAPSEWAAEDWELARLLNITNGTAPKVAPSKEQVVALMFRTLRACGIEPKEFVKQNA